MSDWTVWASFLTLGTASAVLATYHICRARIEQTQGRLRTLERELTLVRLREEANEKRLTRIFDAVAALRVSTEEHLGRVRERLEELRADDYARKHVDAA